MRKENEKKVQKTSYTVLVLILLAANAVIAALLIKNMSELKRMEAQFAETATEQEKTTEDILIELPETVYVASGMTLEIYNSQVTNLAENITKYNVRWNCELGENLKRKFSVTADEDHLGSYELYLEIYDNDLEMIAQKQCVLEIVEEDMQSKEAAKSTTELSAVPAECLKQVKICVDTEYNGALDALKPEGVAQMQDVICSVLSGI